MIRLCQVRRELGLSQAALAQRVRMNPATICLIESGRLKPYDAQIRKLAAGLGWPEARAAELLEEAS